MMDYICARCGQDHGCPEWPVTLTPTEIRHARNLRIARNDREYEQRVAYQERRAVEMAGKHRPTNGLG